MSENKNNEFNVPPGDEEKKKRLIDAAISEFAEKGYTKANTNTIVEKAGVSKGLLFHYFGSKKKLYLYLYDYAMTLILNEYFQDENWEKESELFARWKTASLMKLDMMRKHGDLFEFLLDAYARTDEAVRKDIDLKTMEKVVDTWKHLLQTVDKSRFRDDIDHEKAMKIIYWTINGFSNEKMDDKEKRLAYYEDAYEEMIRELDSYFELLKKVLYK